MLKLHDFCNRARGRNGTGWRGRRVAQQAYEVNDETGLASRSIVAITKDHPEAEIVMSDGEAGTSIDAATDLASIAAAPQS